MHELQKRNPIISRIVRVIQTVNQVGDGSEQDPVQFEYRWNKNAIVFCNVPPEDVQPSA